MKNIRVIITIAILIIAFILIILIKTPSPKEQFNQEVKVPPLRNLTCLETCDGSKACIEQCNTIIINQAVLLKDLNKCNEIEDEVSNNLCRDKVTFTLAVLNKDIARCNNIINIELKDLCNNLAK